MANRAVVPRKLVRRSVHQMEAAMSDIGVDTSAQTRKAENVSKPTKKKAAAVLLAEQDADEQDAARMPSRQQRQRLASGMSATTRSKAERKAKLDARERSKTDRIYETEKTKFAALPASLYRQARYRQDAASLKEEYWWIFVLKLMLYLEK